MPKSTSDFANSFIDYARAAGYEVRSYSGRAMYGKECVAIVTTDSPFTIALELVKVALKDGDDAREAVQELVENLDIVKSDSMGVGSVIYWPYLEWPEGAESDTDEDETED